MRGKVMRANYTDFTIKYNMYKDMIYSIAYTYTHNRSDAEDICQDVFIKYLNSSVEFKTLDNEKYWIIRVVINTSKSYLKKSWKEKVILNYEIVSAGPSDVNSKMFELIHGLSNKYKEIIVLYYYENLKIDEISKILHITKDNAKKRLQRAREMIKERNI